MQEALSPLRHTSRAVLAAAVAIAAFGAALATRTTFTSYAFVGRVFPGFLLLDNRVVPAFGLPYWSGAAVPGLYWSEVVGVDGLPAESASTIYAHVAALPAGRAVRYRVSRAGAENEVVVTSQQFTRQDWFLLFGPFLLNGITSLACGLMVWMLAPPGPAVRAFLTLGCTAGLLLLTAMDRYGPWTFSTLGRFCEPLLPGPMLQLALVFPRPGRYARWRLAGWAVAVPLALLQNLFYDDPVVFVPLLRATYAFLGLVFAVLCVRWIRMYRHEASPLARERLRVVTIGSCFGFAPAGIAAVITALTGGRTAMNLVTFPPFVFGLAVAYAITKHDLLQIDAMVRRGAYYLVLTGLVAAAYIGGILVLDRLLHGGIAGDSTTLPMLLALVILLLFNPLRSRLQVVVDRFFFGTRYDGARVLAAVGARLASALTRDEITQLVRESVETVIPTGRTQLLEHVPPALATPLTREPVLSVADPPDVYADAAAHGAARAALVELGAEVAVPMRRGGQLVGALIVGPKRAGIFYTAADAEFLRALAQQAAIALQNAASFESLVDVNTHLEACVRERTAQLVQSEKLASLGRLVAGVAHEINNPVSFIVGSVAPLRQRLEEARAAAPPRAHAVLQEAEELVDIMARGAQRTAAIVRDLRCFARPAADARRSVDLREEIEVSVRLLEPRWRDRIVIHREFGTVPPVACDPGQLSQVFMNLLANACDAITGSGRIWIRTQADDGTVRVSIRDDGCGMTPEVLSHLFDPFFTTKDVGQGSGLGLAISHGVVQAHGGRIEVESAPGAGSTFHVVLPYNPAGASLDRAATGGG